jgi:hypothetical protein
MIGCLILDTDHIVLVESLSIRDKEKSTLEPPTSYDNWTCQHQDNDKSNSQFYLDQILFALALTVSKITLLIVDY